MDFHFLKFIVWTQNELLWLEGKTIYKVNPWEVLLLCFTQEKYLSETMKNITLFPKHYIHSLKIEKGKYCRKISDEFLGIIFLTSENMTSCFDQPLQVFGLEKEI